MPKKKTMRERRKAIQESRTTRVVEPDREPTFVDRLKKNPLSVLLGVIIIGSMVLGLASELFFSSKPQPVAPTAVPIAFNTPTPAAPATPPSAASPVARKTYSAPPPMTIDVNKTYTATIETNKGVIKLQLLPAVAPKTVNAFITLARDGYYDGLTFHRVEDWVVQGGDPTGTGTGGPGYTLPAEFNATKHIVGTLAMARSNDPNSAGSQFYIVKKEAPWLDNQYTVFGQTIEGMDVVNKLAIGDTMRKVTIEEK